MLQGEVDVSWMAFRSMMRVTSTRTLVFALLALACGHMLSTLLRTIPAISLDLMAADFGTPPQTLASLTSVYHFAFAASQIPVGAAMDRFGVRPVSLSLLVGTIFGAMASGLARGPESFSVRTIPARRATSGMLMCPMTLAAKAIVAGAIWPLVGCHPLDRQYRNAAVVEPACPRRRSSWLARRIWVSAGLGVVVLFAVLALVPRQQPAHADVSSPLAQMAEVLRLGLSRQLRGLIALALVSLAGVAGAARTMGRPMADGRQGIEPHRGRQRARPVHVWH